MILSENDIIELMAHPLNREAIDEAIKIQNEHKVHVTGEHYKDYIKQVIGYENYEQYAQKKELSEPVTMVFTKKIIDEQSRWQDAGGTKKYYEFRNVNREKDLKNILKKVWKGESMDYFINEFVRDALYTEFNGFIIVEQGKIEQVGEVYYEVRDGIKSVVKDNTIMPYLIFRSIDQVYDFRVKGNKVEYLILDWDTITDELGAEIHLYRVLDDQFDRIIENDGGEWKISTRPGYQPIPNPLGYVPSVQISIKKKDVQIDEVKTSYIYQCIPLLKTYLTQWCEHIITCILHAHPIYWQLGQKCHYREGDNECTDGYIYTKDSNKKICPVCKGIGAVLRKDATTALILPQVDEEGKPFDVSAAAGYVAPPTEILKFQIEQLTWIRDDIYLSGTGMNKLAETQIEKTATEAILNYKPLEKIISDILDNIEYVETSLTDMIGKLSFGDNYIRCNIVYDRSLNLRDENTILTEIAQAKNAGASTSFVRTLHRELIYSRYYTSPVDLERNMLLSALEPLIGYTPIELNSLPVDNKTKVFKVFFGDYIVRFESEHALITDYKENLPYNERLKLIKEILDGYNDEKVNELKADSVDEQVANGDAEGSTDKPDGAQ
jgi:hypothetical protein